MLRMHPPTMLLELWEETGVHFGRSKKKHDTKKSPKLLQNNPHTELLLKSPSSSLLKASDSVLDGDVSFKQPSSAEESGVLRSQTARNNWKRLARKASERQQKELINGNSDGEF
ncbi:hypothetical protein OSTOST_10152 [Ostertagia ostertagi]